MNRVILIEKAFAVVLPLTRQNKVINIELYTDMDNNF